ncbi:MAG: hypothetical protein V7K53_17180 [Nostoc sp.]
MSELKICKTAAPGFAIVKSSNSHQGAPVWTISQDILASPLE